MYHFVSKPKVPPNCNQYILAGLVTFLSMFVHILWALSVVSKSHKKSFKFLDEIDEINNKCIFQNRLINAVKEYSQILIFERTLTTKKKKEKKENKSFPVKIVILRQLRKVVFKNTKKVKSSHACIMTLKSNIWYDIWTHQKFF